MSKSIKRFEQFPPELLKMQDEAGEEFAIGDLFFNTRGDDVYRIKELRENEKWANNTQGDKTKVKYWEVVYEHTNKWDASEFSSYGSKPFDEFLEKVKEGEYVKIDRPFSEVMDEAKKVIAGEISIDVYSQNEYANSMNEETALIGKNGKDNLLAIQNALTEKRKVASLIHKAVAFEMKKRKQELETIKDNLYGVVATFQKQIKKIMRVITTIELYLGIDEEIMQIQEGEKAPADTPISFRQLVLFIDEEVGAYEDGGLDWKSIEQFDKWLLEKNNLDIVLPEKKGMVVLRPRRENKHYHDNPWVNSFMNTPNHKHTYFLIRNGDNVYRIFTEKLTVSDRLFPRRDELQKLYDKMQNESWDRRKEEIEDEMYQYKDRAMLMKGLVDRTEIFHPLPVENLNIFKLDDAQHAVNFIYDDEMQLPTGKLSFHDWWKMIDKKITEGSRILITGIFDDYRKEYGDRFYLAKQAYDGLKNVPDLPKEGIYEVELFTSSYVSKLRETEYHVRLKEYKTKGVVFDDLGESKQKTWVHADEKTGSKKQYLLRIYEEESALTIMYKPNAEAKNGWNDWRGHERKHRTRFKIENDDNFLINYDQIDLDDVNFYIYSRVDRKNYLSMMPVLKKIRKHLLEEQKNEQDFIRFVSDRNEKTLSELTRKEIERRVTDTIAWWKYKNKWKRPITKDDTLALRMIEKRIVSPNYNKLKTLEE